MEKQIKIGQREIRIKQRLHKEIDIRKRVFRIPAKTKEALARVKQDADSKEETAESPVQYAADRMAEAEENVFGRGMEAVRPRLPGQRKERFPLFQGKMREAGSSSITAERTSNSVSPNISTGTEPASPISPDFQFHRWMLDTHLPGREIFSRPGGFLPAGSESSPSHIPERSSPHVDRQAKELSRTVKRAKRSVQTADRTVKTTVKTGKAAAQTGRQAVQSVRTAKQTVRATVKGAKAAGKAIVAAVKAAVSAIKGLVELIAAGGWVAVVIILLLVLVGVMLCSPFGILSGGDASKPTSQIILELEAEKAAYIRQLEETQQPDRTVIRYRGAENGESLSNWVDILAVYAVRYGLDRNSGASVAVWDQDAVSRLTDVYWDMVVISYEQIPYTVDYDDGTSETLQELSVLIDCKTYEDMSREYRFDQEQKEALAELMRPEYVPLWEAVTGTPAPSGPSTGDLQAILDSLPEGLDLRRQAVIEAALSLKGRVHYFWGGKSSVIGWDDRWGTPAVVTSPGEDSLGTTRPFGLDCSGFTAWAFINGGQEVSVGQAVGYSTTEQWQRSVPLNWSDAQPGDLVFLAPPGERKYNHVGIIVGMENGDYLVAHCASGQDSVVVTSARAGGFRYARRPVVYGE